MSGTFKESEAALLIAVALAAALPALHVAGTAAADGACDLPAALEAALRSRLPGVRVDRDLAQSPGDLRAQLSRGPAAWLLELQGDAGVALSRELLLPQDECAVAAETSALVVERFLEEVRWSGRPQPIAPLPSLAPPPPPLIVAPLPLQRPRPHALALALGPAAWLGLPSDLRPAALLEASARLGEQLRLGGSFLLGGAATQTVTIESQVRGTTSVSAGLLAAHASLCDGPGALSLCAGALVGARGSLGSSSGTLFQKSSAFLVQPEVGVRASAGLRLGSRWELGLALIGGVALGSASFVVDGAQAQRSLPRLDVAAALRLAWEAL